MTDREFYGIQPNSPKTNNKNQAGNTQANDHKGESMSFEAGQDNILDSLKKNIGKKSWFQRLFG